MLKTILAEFHQADHSLCAADLQAALALDLGVIEGMLQTLVQRGRLVEVVDASTCHTCPVRGGCVILTLTTPKRYTLLHPT
jgi:hypothetical protein